MHTSASTAGTGNKDAVVRQSPSSLPPPGREILSLVDRQVHVAGLAPKRFLGPQDDHDQGQHDSVKHDTPKETILADMMSKLNQELTPKSTRYLSIRAQS